MAKPDWLRGLKDIGKWELYWWGSKWILTHDEVEKAINIIQVNKEKAKKKLITFTTMCGATGVTITALEGIIFPPAAILGFFGAGLGATNLAAMIGSFEVFISRLRATDQGKGVVVDFYLTYLNFFVQGKEHYCSIYPKRPKRTLL